MPPCNRLLYKQYLLHTSATLNLTPIGQFTFYQNTDRQERDGAWQRAVTCWLLLPTLSHQGPLCVPGEKLTGNKVRKKSLSSTENQKGGADISWQLHTVGCNLSTECHLIKLVFNRGLNGGGISLQSIMWAKHDNVADTRFFTPAGVFLTCKSKKKNVKRTECLKQRLPLMHYMHCQWITWFGFIGHNTRRCHWARVFTEAAS